MFLAAAFLVIQIGATVRAETAAIAAADDFHRQREIYLFGEDVREEQAVTFEEGDFGVVEIQVKFFINRDGGHWPVIQIEIAADFLDDRIQAARADQLDACVKVAIDADLPFDELGSRADLERFNLAELTGMEIERSGSVTLPDAELAYGEFVDVEKHGFSPYFAG